MKIIFAKTTVTVSLFVLILTAGLMFAKSATGEPSGKKNNNNHQIRVPGYNVSGPNVTVSGVSTQINKGSKSKVSGGSQGFILQNQQGRRSIFYGGGGGYIGGGSVPTVINNLMIEGGYQTKTITEQIEVPYMESIESSRWIENVYVIQAVCMDDTGTPHPASRPDPNEHVEPDFTGELFRCMAGTWMQVTMAEYDGDDWKNGTFDNGSTMVCKKGEALVHHSGSKITCAPQAPHRNCNERSLLRKFGTGVKIVRIAREEHFSEQVQRTRTETRTREITVEAPAHAVSKTLILSGGVGGG